jgi:hypothetical protein
MTNDGSLPVLNAAGSLVTHVRLIDSDVRPSYAEAAADSFSSSITPTDIQHAMSDAIADRLAEYSL